MQFESAGKRRNGQISHESSVALRRALIDLGIGLWLIETAAKAYTSGLRDRGKHGEIVMCAWPIASSGLHTHWFATRRLRPPRID